MSKLEKQFKRIDIFIKCLKWFLVALIVVFTSVELAKHTLCSFPCSLNCLGSFLFSVVEITKVIIPLLAALLATLVADRLITHSLINNKNEKLQTAYRYIAITNDLEQKVIHFTKMITDGGEFLSSVIVISESIEKRYESLYDKELYKHISDEMVNTINDMSGSIYGLVSSTALAKDTLKNSPTSPLPPIKEPPTEDLRNKIAELKNDFYELRKSAKSS